MIRRDNPKPMGLAEVTSGATFVYVLTAEKIVKIGISRNVDARAAQIQTGFPYKIAIARRWRTPFASEIETTAHKCLGEYRLHGEWFDIPVGVATAMVGLLVWARPRTRPKVLLGISGILYCQPCDLPQQIRSTPQPSKTYCCQRCGAEMGKFNIRREEPPKPLTAQEEWRMRA